MTFVAWLSACEGVLAIAVSALFLWALSSDAVTVREAASNVSVQVVAAFILSGLALLMSAVGLLRLCAWAWTLAMATQCVTLTITLYKFLSGDPEDTVMAIGVLAVLLLNREEVRLAFQRPERN